MAEDFYKTLEVSRSASQAEIQKAYRDLARKYHPDVNPGDKSATKKFQEIQAAFDVLNDPEKREMYDRYGSSFQARGAGGPQSGTHTYRWGGGENPFGGEGVDFGQFFGERFGEDEASSFADLFTHFRRGAAGRGSRQSASARRGGDIIHELQIPFATAIAGGEAQIALQRPSGKTETIAVKIPAGIEDGKRIRIRGQGEQPARGGTAGDILITIRVAPHPFFHRQGNNLHVRVPVTLGEAVLGGKVDVPTPKGTVSLSVPPGSSSGTKLRVKGHGVTGKDGVSGDLMAELQVVIPKDLTEADRQMIREFEERHPQQPRANLRW